GGRHRGRQGQHHPLPLARHRANAAIRQRQNLARLLGTQQARLARQAHSCLVGRRCQHDETRVTPVAYWPLGLRILHRHRRPSGRQADCRSAQEAGEASALCQNTWIISEGDQMIVRPLQYICDLNPYQPGTPIELVAREHGLDPGKIIKLASNENPLGMSPKAEEAVRRALEEGHRYPDQYQLTHRLSAKLGVAPENIVLGNGSNDVLDLIARTFLDEGREAVSSRYAFAVYPIATQSAGATNIIVADRNFGNDLEAMLAAITPKTGIVWIVNPNNPTGTLTPYTELKQFVEKVPREV